MGNAMVFDEQAWLAANPDVAAAVQSGAMPSAQYHYDNFGASEIASGTRAPVAFTGAAPQPAPTQQSLIDQSGLNMGGIDWSNYRTVNNDLSGMTDQQARQHFIDYGQFENNRSLGYQTAANQGQFYNLRDGTELGPTNAGEMNAFVNNNFTNHTGFDANTFAGTGGGVTDPTVMNPDAVNFVQGGGSMAGTSATYGRNAFDPNAFADQMQGMFKDWTSQFQDEQNQYGQYTDQFQNNLWNTTPQSPTYAANSWQTAYNQSPTLDPVYQANNGGAQNGFQPTFNQSNPFSIRTF
jgi:hypothetical protein